jgi:hypothetical protein
MTRTITLLAWCVLTGALTVQAQAPAPSAGALTAANAPPSMPGRKPGAGTTVDSRRAGLAAVYSWDGNAVRATRLRAKRPRPQALGQRPGTLPGGLAPGRRRGLSPAIIGGKPATPGTAAVDGTAMRPRSVNP